AAVDVDGDGAAAAVRGVEIRLGERHRQNAPVVVDAAAGDFGEVLIHNTSVDIQEPLEVVDAAALLHFPVGASITVKAVVFHRAAAREQVSFVEDAAAVSVQVGTAGGVSFCVAPDDNQVVEGDGGTVGNLEDARGMVAVDRGVARPYGL